MAEPKDACRPLPAMGGAGFFARALLTAARSGIGTVDGTPARFVAPPLEPQRVGEFASFFAFPAAGPVPLGCLFLLAQRAQVAVMLAPRFPQPVIGLVHVGNEVQRLAPLDPQAPIELACRAGSEGDAGAVRITLQVELSQRGAAFAVARSTYLARRRATRRNGGGPPPACIDAPIASYALDASAGRRYARLSGDLNPIHLWRWSARLFGMPRPIIHGMHTVAGVEASLASRFDRPVTRIAARFRRPIALPSQVVVHARDGRFQACADDAVCVDGDYLLGP